MIRDLAVAWLLVLTAILLLLVHPRLGQLTADLLLWWGGLVLRLAVLAAGALAIFVLVRWLLGG